MHGRFSERPPSQEGYGPGKDASVRGLKADHTPRTARIGLFSCAKPRHKRSVAGGHFTRIPSARQRTSVWMVD
jgi:hypothetical protein